MVRIDRRRFAAVLLSIPLAGCLGDDSGVDEGEWEDVGEIRLEAHADRWEGISPDVIADEENPTLVLFEGREYEVVWENVDGIPQNIEFRDEDGERIVGTDLMSGSGETQTLTFEASERMVEYVSFPQETTLVGDVEVVAPE